MFKKFLIFGAGILAGVAIVKKDAVCEKVGEGFKAARDMFNEYCNSSKCTCNEESTPTGTENFEEVK